MPRKRKKVPQKIESEILLLSKRRCCICYGLDGVLDRKRGQIAHLDHNPESNAIGNLAFLCFDHHDEYDSSTKQSKGMNLREVKVYREELYSLVRDNPSAVHSSKSTQIGRDLILGDVVSGNKNHYEVAGDLMIAEQVVVETHALATSRQPSKRPYRFLAAYNHDDSERFYGREGDISILYGLLADYRVVVLTGSSGVGKTSLLNAGIIPKIAADGKSYVALNDYSEAERELLSHIEERLQSERNTEVSGSSKQTNGQAGQETTLVLDQFERIFSLPENESRNLISTLAGLLQGDKGSHRLIVSIRKDMLGSLGEFQGIFPFFSADVAHYFLRSLGPRETKEVIEKPLLGLDDRIEYQESLLTDHLLPDLLEGEGESLSAQPAQVQIVCSRLFDELIRSRSTQKRLKEGKTVYIDCDLYEKLGGVSGILNGYLSEQIQNYGADLQLTRRILKQMVTPAEITKLGLRRFVTSEQIASALDIESSTSDFLLSRLLNDRLLERRGKNDLIQYSLAHEYMIKEILSWYDPDEADMQKAKDLLERSWTNWVQFKSLMADESLIFLEEVGEKLNPSSDHILLIILSSLLLERPIEGWLERTENPVALKEIFYDLLESERVDLRLIGIRGLRYT